MTVHGVAEERAALLFYTDYAHRQPADFKRLSNRILVREKFFFDIGAEHYHESRAFHFVVRNVAAELDSFVFDINHVGGVTEDLGPDIFNSILPQIGSRT